jgi:hypothetical protein
MRRLLAFLPVLGLAALVISGCTGSSVPPAPTAEDTSIPSAFPIDARTRLAGLAATAKDRHFTAGYTYRQADRPPRTVTVTLAADGTWRVDVPGGALDGQANVALVGTSNGLYQCRLPDDGPGCAKAADPDGSFPASMDPRVEHPFTDWLDPLTDQQSAISVAAAPLLAGARGTCFSIEANSAALAPPVEPGIYCYDTDGTLTGLRVSFGTLVLASPPAPAPPTVTLPGPVTAGALVPTAAPPGEPGARPSDAPTP